MQLIESSRFRMSVPDFIHVFFIIFYGIHEGFAVAVWLPSLLGSPQTSLPLANTSQL
jgi:hypothetical protein